MNFRVSHHRKEIASNEIDKMRDAGNITTPSSVRLFPIVILTEQDVRTRFSEDYGTLNRKIKTEVWLLHKIKYIFDGLKESSISTTLKRFLGYSQVQMSE